MDKRNQLRQKLGKNKIAPQAQTDLDIKAEQIESIRKESPTSWDIFTVEEKKHEEVAVVTAEKVEPKSEENVGDNVSTGGIEKVEDNVSTGEIDKAGGDAALCELIFLFLLFIFNFLYFVFIDVSSDRKINKYHRFTIAIQEL